MTRKAWTDREDAMVLADMANNYACSSTARILGRSEKSVYARRCRLKRGIKAQENKPPPSHKPAEYKKPKSEHEAKQRNCLKCQTPFMSEWAGNRLCDACKRGAQWRAGTIF